MRCDQMLILTSKEVLREIHEITTQKTCLYDS